MPPPRHYYYRRPRPRSRGNPRLETAVTLAVIAVVIATLIVFLWIYHDLPLRVSGP